MADPGILATSVEITGKTSRDATLKVGGSILPCQSLTLNMDAEAGLQVLTVRLPVLDGVVVTLAHADAGLDEETRAALISMGWTPPGGPFGPLSPILPVPADGPPGERPAPRPWKYPMGAPGPAS